MCVHNSTLCYVAGGTCSNHCGLTGQRGVLAGLSVWCDGTFKFAISLCMLASVLDGCSDSSLTRTHTHTHTHTHPIATGPGPRLAHICVEAS